MRTIREVGFTAEELDTLTILFRTREGDEVLDLEEFVGRFPVINSPIPLRRGQFEGIKGIFIELDGLRLMVAEGHPVLPPSLHSLKVAEAAADLGLAALENGYFTREHPIALDIGTGSGIMVLGFVRRLRQLNNGSLPFEVGGTDIDEHALASAYANALFNNELDIALVRNNLLGGIGPGMLDMVISNPPFIPKANMPADLDHMVLAPPPHALYGGASGLAYYAALFEQARTALSPEGLMVLQFGGSKAKEGLMQLVAQLLPDRSFEYIPVGYKENGDPREALVVGGASLQQIISHAGLGSKG